MPPSLNQFCFKPGFRSVNYRSMNKVNLRVVHHSYFSDSRVLRLGVLGAYSGDSSANIGGRYRRDVTSYWNSVEDLASGMC